MEAEGKSRKRKAEIEDLEAENGIADFGLWTLDFGLWTLDFELQVGLPKTEV
jgi:hypothetical protein